MTMKVSQDARQGVDLMEVGMVVTLEEALAEAELEAVKTRTINLDQVLELARVEAQHPSVVAVWRDTDELAGGHEKVVAEHMLGAAFPASTTGGRKKVAAALVIGDSLEPQAVGHALVMAASGGHINCVRRLRELQREHMGASMLVSRFAAFAFLKSAEQGHVEVARELLRPTASTSTAMMGYAIATRWKDSKDQSASSSNNNYPFVKPAENLPGKVWLQKLASTKSLLPRAAAPIFRPGVGWELRGLPAVRDEVHDAIRAAYTTYLVWRVATVAAMYCHADVFKLLLKQRALENTILADTFHDTSRLNRGFDSEGKKVIADRAKMDTLFYQLVEELSTKNYHDCILYALWGHIQRGGRDSPRPHAGRPRCVAQAQYGLWEMQLEVPLLMMPVEHALQDLEPYRRYKHLTQLFSQRAKVNIQLVALVEAMPTYIQVTVGIKHVRFKVENSRWDVASMGHFPSLVSLSVTPMTTEGTGVTMTNSSSNIVVKIGKMERLQLGTGVSDGASQGLSGRMGISSAIGVTSTMKNKPWRFEQLPLKDERGGSFVWTLQAMKGAMFDRSNPIRLQTDGSSLWRFAKRIPVNPLDELPFTSEGGIIFTNAEFDDTMIWRFPKHMDGCKLRWSIEGQIHCTYTSNRYFETRMASFCGDIEEKLVALEVKDKKGNPKFPKAQASSADAQPPKGDKKEKGEKGEKGDKGEKGEKVDKGEKSEKGEKGNKHKDNHNNVQAEDLQSDPEYLEWLEFKKFKSRVHNHSQDRDTIRNNGNQLFHDSPPAPRYTVGTRKAVSGPLLSRLGEDLIGVGVEADYQDLNKPPEIWKRKVERESSHGEGAIGIHSADTAQMQVASQRISGLEIRQRSVDLGR